MVPNDKQHLFTEVLFDNNLMAGVEGFELIENRFHSTFIRGMCLARLRHHFH